MIDCIHHGYSLCMAELELERIWNWWDNSYAEYCKTQEAKYEPSDILTI